MLEAGCWPLLATITRTTGNNWRSSSLNVTGQLTTRYFSNCSYLIHFRWRMLETRVKVKRQGHAVTNVPAEWFDYFHGGCKP